MPFVALLAFAPIAVATPSTSAPPAPPRLHAQRVAAPPDVDGALDDAAWEAATPSGAFTQRIPNDGAAATDPTTVRVVYDDDAVYVAVDCPQAHAPVTPRLTRRDRVVEVDSVTIDLGTVGDHRSAFEFSVNASGVLSDAVRFDDTESSSDWDESWEARTRVTPGGWTAEIRIPLRVLRFPSRPAQSWDFQATRYVSATKETDVWAYSPRSAAGEVSRYGRLEIGDALHPKTPIELRPFAVARVRRRDPGQAQLASGWDARASGGLDLKWHPRQDLTLDVTFNPDFAQVEADQVVMNLSNVETYYPEKRPFFLEGIDAFSTPFQLVYTRRIGRVPATPPLRDGAPNDERLVDAPEPSPIYAATKLTGSLGKGWSVGTLQALTGPNHVEVQRGDGGRESRLVDPTSAFGVARIKRDLGDHAHVAVMATAVTHAERTDAYPRTPGSPATQLCPNPVELTPMLQTTLTPAPRARCFADAFVGGVDGRWRSPGGDYVAGGQLAASLLANGPVRPVADGTAIRSGDLGWGLQAYATKEGGEHWVGGLRADVESAKFDITDLGYDTRANRVLGYANVEYRDLSPRGPFREVHAYASVRSTHAPSGLPLGTTAYLVSYGHLKNLWEYAVDVHAQATRFDDREVGDGTALERAARVGTETVLGSDPTARVSVSVDQLTEIARDGASTTGNATVAVRVLPQLDFDLLPTWQWAFGEPRYAGAGLVTGEYLFGRLEAKSVGLTLRTTYTFTPRITLQGYAQLFLASGHYARFSDFRADPAGPRPVVHLAELSPYSGAVATNPDFEQGIVNVNAVLRWEYALGSTLYFVYTRSQSPTTILGAGDVATLDLGAVRRAPKSDAFLVKLTFWWAG